MSAKIVKCHPISEIAMVLQKRFRNSQHSLNSCKKGKFLQKVKVPLLREITNFRNCKFRSNPAEVANASKNLDEIKKRLKN
mgnify:CR=1 FL=1